MTKIKVGKTVYEMRGDDFFIVSATSDGDVVELQQYDAIGHRYETINFFSSTAPKLIELIKQAAGIKDEKVEYEYNLKTSNGEGVLYTDWTTPKMMVDLWNADNIQDVKPRLPERYTLVRRIKPGAIEDA